MLDESSREHLQPMQDKMEHFLCVVKQSILNLNTKLTSTQELFNKVSEHPVQSVSNSFMQVVQYYAVNPKSGEDHVSLSHFFSLWSKFSHDLKKEWLLQQKLVAKQRASALRRDKSTVVKKPAVAGGLVSLTLRCL